MAQALARSSVAGRVAATAPMVPGGWDRLCGFGVGQENPAPSKEVCTSGRNRPQSELWQPTAPCGSSTTC